MILGESKRLRTLLSRCVCIVSEWSLVSEDSRKEGKRVSKAKRSNHLTNLVYCHSCDVLFGWSQAPPQSITEARRLARQAASLDEKDPWVKGALWLTEFTAKDPDTAISHYRKAIELD